MASGIYSASLEFSDLAKVRWLRFECRACGEYTVIVPAADGCCVLPLCAWCERLAYLIAEARGHTRSTALPYVSMPIADPPEVQRTAQPHGRSPHRPKTMRRRRKLTSEQRAAIRHLHYATPPRSLRELARDFSISVVTVCAVLREGAEAQPDVITEPARVS